KAIQGTVNEQWLPPAEVQPALKEPVVPSVLFKNARRNYLMRVVHQINTTYQHACYDSCAVMIRRLIESLIIEVFEAKKIDSKIKGPAGEFYMLRDLITATLNEPWNLARNAKTALGRLKTVGDLSAHSRRYNASRHDIEDFIPDIRIVVQELLTLAGLR
ncbi:MAG TPA: hypothetical protein VFW76_06860, partial [Ktedonobacterales bacterium]|nr:hypothetical protein [Ktedonobacterales bacterium]